MKDRELVAFLQRQNEKLIGTIESLTQTIEDQTKELTALKNVLLKQGKDAEKLKRLANINLPKKTEKRKNTNPVADDKTLAPKPKERGNNGSKRKVYDNIEEIVEDVLPCDASFDIKIALFLLVDRVVQRKAYYGYSSVNFLLPSRLYCRSWSFTKSILTINVRIRGLSPPVGNHTLP